jgi:uracil-DNA glycosylase family 4
MSQQTEISELIAEVREQVLYMKELGVELLGQKATKELAAATAGRQEVSTEHPMQTERFVPKATPETAAKPASKRPSRLSAMPSLTSRPPSERRPVAATTEPSASIERTKERNEASHADALFDIGPALPDSGETIEDIRRDIDDCTRCELFSGRTQIVHSTGNFQADLMFVGEAPGADEDAQGFPFVGRAGQLLTKIIEGIGYQREDVFIGNINRCRPPGNRQPTLQEAHTCRPFLLREIAVVRPKVIVVLGNTALHNLLDTKIGITKIRGQFQDYFGVKVMPTFHPAFLLRDPSKKREVWEDMKKVRDYLNSVK